MTDRIDAPTLKSCLSDGGEIALIDVREAGQFADGHPFLAASAPYSVFELRIGALVPGRRVRLVLCDDGSGVAERAARRAEALGYGRVLVLDGGTAAWAHAGYTLYAGVNVPSKTFGELVEHERGTPHVTAEELAAMREAGGNMVIVDGRTFAEFRRFAIPGGISCPNGELALRIDKLAPDPETTIVVNCAGRTRSIIGAQTLIDLGLPNPVVALENGTQGWILAGLELETGAARRCADGIGGGLDARRMRARRHAARRGVRYVDRPEISAWLGDQGRTTYLFDIRSPDEHEADPHGGLVPAPGGQLIQASDQWIGVRGARVVVADEELVRAPMVAAWLRELGFDAHVLNGGVAAADSLGRQMCRPAMPPALPQIRAGELREGIERGGARIIDLRASSAYREGHIRQAEWSIRPVIAPSPVEGGRTVVLVAGEPGTAELAAIDLAEAGAGDIRMLAEPREAWEPAGLAIEATPGEPADEDCIDFASFTHGRHHGDLEASRRYLAWEIGLIGQLDEQERSVFKIVPGRTGAGQSA